MGICITSPVVQKQAIYSLQRLPTLEKKQKEIAESLTRSRDNAHRRVTELYEAVLLHPFSITVMNLSPIRLGASDCHQLAQLLPLCPNITSLKLSKCKIGPKGAGFLSETLHELPLLEVLSLEDNDFGIEGAKSLTYCLTYLENLREFHCRSNNVQFEGIKYIADGLSNLRHLTQLMVDDNDITSYGLKYLLDNVRLSKLEILGLSHDRITDCGAQALIQSAAKLAHLKSLMLAGNLVNTREKHNLQRIFPNTSISI